MLTRSRLRVSGDHAPSKHAKSVRRAGPCSLLLLLQQQQQQQRAAQSRLSDAEEVERSRRAMPTTCASLEKTDGSAPAPTAMAPPITSPVTVPSCSVRLSTCA